jgi:predicted dienelactone hydrolase
VGKERILGVIFVSLFLATAGWTQAGVAGTSPDPEQKGPYAVGHTFLMMTDASRGDRPIAVYVFYPVDPASVTSATPRAEYPLDPYNYMGWPNTNSADWEAYGFDAAYHGVQVSSGKPFPLVMFSPGWGCAAWFYMFLLPRLASHGYVVAALTHSNDWTLPLEPFDHIAVTAMNRPPDVSFALTQLLAKNATAGDLLFNAVMPDRIAASGHSFGGYASMVLAGGDDNVGEIFDSAKNQRLWGGFCAGGTSPWFAPQALCRSLISGLERGIL